MASVLVPNANAFVAYFVFIRSHFRMQGKLTTDCDGSVKHGKWQEPAGTLSVVLTAYTLQFRSLFPKAHKSDQAPQIT